MRKKLDISIAGDEQEQSRILLERNLLHTDLSLHLSSTHDEYSVENPRHQPNISAPFSAFDSIDPSRDALDLDEGLSQPHAWSYRTGEDEEGINPFVGGETLSTAAHHASALTLSAGLGGRGERREISLSGAEYDPERPLQDLIAGIGTYFNAEKGPSRHASNPPFFDPPIVDSTAELNNFFSPQHVAANARRVHSPNSEQSTSSSSEPDTTSSRPKLSDALSHLTFSPKRPRSLALPVHSASPTQPHNPTRGRTSTFSQHETLQPPQPHRPTARSSSLRVPQVDVRECEPTPRPRKVRLRTQDVNLDGLRPPTPSTTNSKFTKLAKGLAREIDVCSSNMKKQLQLPDVTGITVAVESPAKGQSYQPCGDTAKDKDHRDEDHAYLQSAVNILQNKISSLDAENRTSRRRMKELEDALDVCRQAVETQRTLVMQREELLAKQHRAGAATSNSKGKARSVEDTKDEQRHYKQAVEEKKALESLVTTLRSHMSRLTSELSSHKTLLDELRSLREADKDTLRQRVRDVDLLRQEVEKIAGEVEVLKGVVEEGLRDRRGRTHSQPHGEPQGHDMAMGFREDFGDDEVERAQDRDGGLDGRQDAEDYELEDVQPALARRALLERTARADHAAYDSVPIEGHGIDAQRFVDDSELERISTELEERRSERSRSSSRLGSSVSSNGSHRAPSVASSVGSTRSPLIAAPPSDRGATLDSLRQRRRQASRSSVPVTTQDPRPPAPTPGHARERHHAGEVPFPQIRGARLERMFFSAPQHNSNTCTVCNRRRYRDAAPRPLWYPASKGHNVTVADASDEDEGFGEGSVIGDGEGRRTSQGAAANLDFLNGDCRDGHLPPQTVLVRVLRELEDDFTHYKGIYTELADQYKMMDAGSNVVKRNVLAQHLRDVIDVLEQRGDQIASLYDLLTFEDKAVARSMVPEKEPGKHEPRTRSSGSRKCLAFA